MIPTKIVFITKTVEDLCTLLITRRPSSTTAGIDSKLESSKTIFAADLAASDPSPIAIPQSDVFMARISFTPSPVTPTVLPASFNVWMMSAF